MFKRDRDKAQVQTIYLKRESSVNLQVSLRGCAAIFYILEEKCKHISGALVHAQLLLFYRTVFIKADNNQDKKN